MKNALCVLSLALFALLSVETPAATLVVANASFELPAFADASFGQQFITPAQQGGYGWSFTDASGIYNPTALDYSGAGGSGTPAGGTGAQVAFSVQRYALFQTLAGMDGALGNGDDPVLTALTTYTLTAAFGQRLPGNQFGATPGGYSFELLAGATVIAQETDAIALTPGSFVERTITVDSATLSPSLFGQPLTIRLNSTVNQATAATDFDNVRLDAVTVPEPSTGSLLVVATLGFARKRTGAGKSVQRS